MPRIQSFIVVMFYCFIVVKTRLKVTMCLYLNPNSLSTLIAVIVSRDTEENIAKLIVAMAAE